MQPSRALETPHPPAAWTWDTDLVRRGQRFDYHREEVCRALLPITPQPPWRREFHSRGQVVAAGEGAVMRLEITGQHCERTWKDVAAAMKDGFHLNTIVTGPVQRHQLDNGHREFFLAPGKSLLFASGKLDRYDSEHSADMDLGSFWIPRDALCGRLTRGREPGPAMLSDDPTTGPLIAAVEKALLDTRSALRPRAFEDLFEVLVDLVALTLNRHSEIATPAPALRASELLLYQEIARHIRREGLTVGYIAKRLAISPRYVHRLFEGSGQTFGRYVLEQRLEGASRDLRALRFDHLTLITIALRWGFADASHFSRAFRDRYGCSPSHWRKSGRADRLASRQGSAD